MLNPISLAQLIGVVIGAALVLVSGCIFFMYRRVKQSREYLRLAPALGRGRRAWGVGCLLVVFELLGGALKPAAAFVGKWRPVLVQDGASGEEAELLGAVSHACSPSLAPVMRGGCPLT